ncbi:Laccase-11 [Hibiscus syriacus]|uniref:Laccase-11 n=1 Tax=Hibiscus syriacus TaxID=106335 RepID=A0A6A3BC70_HIBSY|nr:Laccase-11 [Hibiscus syriacus]
MESSGDLSCTNVEGNGAHNSRIASINDNAMTSLASAMKDSNCSRSSAREISLNKLTSPSPLSSGNAKRFEKPMSGNKDVIDSFMDRLIDQPSPKLDPRIEPSLTSLDAAPLVNMSNHPPPAVALGSSSAIHGVQSNLVAVRAAAPHLRALNLEMHIAGFKSDPDRIKIDPMIPVTPGLSSEPCYIHPPTAADLPGFGTYVPPLGPAAVINNHGRSDLQITEAAVRKYQFDIRVKNVSRLCHAKPIVTVNGRFPGPTIYAREGDRVLVSVKNYAQYNISIHWHGLKQFRNGWADGPAYITQCPIKTGHSYTYDFTVTGQRGTLWWHAHILWLRATGNGGIQTLKHSLTEPISWGCHRRHLMFIRLTGNQGLSSCVLRNRIINAALNDELFFSIAGHNVTVVEIDAVYTKPFTTRVILIAPGQTTNVLIKADQPPSRYFMAARPFMDAPVPVDNKTVTGILQYKGIPDTVLPSMPKLPAPNNTNVASSYNKRLKSLNTPQFPAKVPLKVDRHLFYTIGLGANPCSTCQNGTQLTASLNNITFVMPKVGLLQAHYFNIKGVFKPDFPDRPPVPFNYTGAPLTANIGTSLGTRLNPTKFNLVDPPERNTVGVPTGGWTAIRFRADNPGVWFMHCHLELHTMWGLKMAFVVENGKSPEESIIPPPKDLPPC